MSAMSAADHGDAPRASGPALVPFGLTMQALLASCAAASAVSTPPPAAARRGGAVAEEAGAIGAAPESEAA
ncbi:hypothetical protein [Streptomyces sp. NPDC048603]|uniref:hypothetical protein n=1 Tax=Streptomyces sp. NPDC048603 TaxID=3365577 RepID=UPI00371E26C8